MSRSGTMNTAISSRMKSGWKTAPGSVSGSVSTEDQGEVFDCDDGRNEIDGVEEFPRPLAERELRHEIAQGQQPGQEEDGEQDRLVERISQRSEDEGDRYGRHEPPEKGEVLFHGGD